MDDSAEQQARVMLTLIMDALVGSKPADVEALSCEALEALLGIDPADADALTPDELVALLSPDGVLDITRARLAAEVYTRRVQAFVLCGEPHRTLADVARAERLVEAVLKVLATAADGLDDAAEVTQLLEELREAREKGATTA